MTISDLPVHLHSLVLRSYNFLSNDLVPFLAHLPGCFQSVWLTKPMLHSALLEMTQCHRPLRIRTNDVFKTNGADR